ncbi:MAG: hypothetical protein Q8936_24230, partial [Bacillota bacterium]|nr:hypothetical protein [Bacillota bacterium]
MKRYLRKGSSIFIAFVMILSQLIALPQVVFASEPWGSFGIDYIISTVAGNQNDHSGNTTDGISARADALSYPQGIALDSRGNMYFAEPGKNKIY